MNSFHSREKKINTLLPMWNDFSRKLLSDFLQKNEINCRIYHQQPFSMFHIFNTDSIFGVKISSYRVWNFLFRWNKRVKWKNTTKEKESKNSIFVHPKGKCVLAVIETKAYGKKIAVTSLNTGRAAFISIIQTCNSFKFPIEIKCNMPSINNHKNQ